MVSLALVSLLAAASGTDAHANRGAARSQARAPSAARTRAARPAPKARASSKLKIGPKLAANARISEVRAAFKELHTEAHKGYAAAMYVIPKKGVQETELKSQGEYGSNQSQEVQVTGLGSSGVYQADFLGSVSTHNEGARFVGDPAGMRNFISNRVAGDGVKIVHIAPSGARTEIVANHPSDVVTHLELAVKLEPGRNVIRYERTDRSSGRIVSAQGLYSEWRSKVIHWDGN